jgi:integrase
VAASQAKAELELLPRLTVHEFHCHPTIVLCAGVPVHIVAKRLGRRDPSVTLNVYADVTPDDDTSAVDVFARAVWGLSDWTVSRSVASRPWSDAPATHHPR